MIHVMKLFTFPSREIIVIEPFAVLEDNFKDTAVSRNDPKLLNRNSVYPVYRQFRYLHHIQ
jgi:hypothetical protein